jgi:urate oxidase
VKRARVSVREHPWTRLGKHPHAFRQGAPGTHVAIASGEGDRRSVEAGIDDLLVLKTTGSGWAGFARDRYTTLPETSDRILATVVTARWDYAGVEVDFGAAWDTVLETVLEAFGDHYSPSVQYTLRHIGDAVLRACADIERIHLSLPNKHHLLFDLSPFGLDNPQEIFHVTSEPYGLIEGTVERTGPEA